MKMIHCADLHLDARMTSNLSKEQARQRKTELLDTFARMIRYAADNEVEAILIAGDLFDSNHVSASARNVVRGEIAAHPEIEFYYLRGNHDTDSALAEDTPPNLHLFGTEWTSYVCGAESGADVVITGAELSPDTAGQGGKASSLARTLVLDADCINLVMLHGQAGRYAGKDRTEEIPLRELRNKGVDYLALGHVHAYAREPLDSRGVYCYSGCLEGRGFDECGPHGFVLLDIDVQKRRIQDRFVPFAARALYTVPVDISGCLTQTETVRKIRDVLSGDASPLESCAENAADRHEADKAVQESGQAADDMAQKGGGAAGGATQESGQAADDMPQAKDLLKIVLTGTIDVDFEPDLPFMQRQLAPDYYFVKLENQTRLHVDAQAYALDASLKGEFVRTVMAAEELSEEEKAAVVQCGIRALSGELEEWI